jgi:hypothetical protein
VPTAADSGPVQGQCIGLHAHVFFRPGPHVVIDPDEPLRTGDVGMWSSSVASETTRSTHQELSCQGTLRCLLRLLGRSWDTQDRISLTRVCVARTHTANGLRSQPRTSVTPPPIPHRTRTHPSQYAGEYVMLDATSYVIEFRSTYIHITEFEFSSSKTYLAPLRYVG